MVRLQSVARTPVTGLLWLSKTPLNHGRFQILLKRDCMILAFCDNDTEIERRRGSQNVTPSPTTLTSTLFLTLKPRRLSTRWSVPDSTPIVWRHLSRADPCMTPRLARNCQALETKGEPDGSSPESKAERKPECSEERPRHVLPLGKVAAEEFQCWRPRDGKSDQLIQVFPLSLCFIPFFFEPHAFVS